MKQKTFARSSVNLAALAGLALAITSAHAAPVALINGNLETPGTNFPALNANINPAHGWINPGGNSWALTTTGPSSPQEAGGSGAMHGLINGLAGGDAWQITSTPMVEGTTYTAMMDIYHRDFSSLGNGVFRLLSDTVSGGGGTRTILNSTTGISAPAGVGQWLLDVTVRYTATASDAGKFIGIAIGNASGGNNWIEFDNVRLDASIGGDTPFADWAAGYTPPMIAGVDDGFGDDHDLDGTPNGHEFYFFDSDPTVAGAHGSPISGAARTAANKFEFTHNRRLDRTDVTETYQWSSDLDNWYDADGLASDGTNTVSVADKTVVAGPTANLETVTVEATVGGGTMSKLFLRLNLSSP